MNNNITLGQSIAQTLFAELSQLGDEYRKATEQLSRGSGVIGGIKTALANTAAVVFTKNNIARKISKQKTALASNKELALKLGRQDGVDLLSRPNLMHEVGMAHIDNQIEAAIEHAIEVYQESGCVSIEMVSGHEHIETFIDTGGVTQIVGFFDMLREEYTAQTLSDAVFTVSIDRAFKALGNKTNKKMLVQAVKFGMFGPVPI